MILASDKNRSTKFSRWIFPNVVKSGDINNAEE